MSNQWTACDRKLLEQMRRNLADYFPYILRTLGDGLSEVSVARFEQAGLLRKRGEGAYDIVIAALEAVDNSPEQPAGPALLKESDPESCAYRERNSWCDKHFACKRYGITPQQLNRASRQANGLYGVAIAGRKAEHGLLVYLAADLQRLANVLDRAREDRE